MKNTQQFQPFSRPLFYFLLALSIVIWILILVVVILEGAFSLVGFNNSVQISTACDSLTETYYYTKYNSNNSTIVTFCFIYTIFALLFSTAVTVILLVLLIKMRKEEVIAFRKAVKVGLYVCASLFVVTATIPAGYYLAYSRQLPQCALTSYDSTQVRAIAIIAIIAVAFGFLLWLLLLIFFYERVSSQQKYREVSSNHTEPQQKAQVYKYEQEKPKKQPQVIYRSPEKEQPRREVYRHEETQQNLYESPSKRKINYVYSKEPQQSHNQRKNYSVLESKGPLAPQEKKYTPERSYQREPENNQRYVLQRKNPTVRKDEQAYKEYQNQYLRNRGMGSILPTSGVQQRQYKNSDYFKSVGEAPRRLSPSKKSDKQGVLVSYIRGKYAN